MVGVCPCCPDEGVADEEESREEQTDSRTLHIAATGMELYSRVCGQCRATSERQKVMAAWAEGEWNRMKQTQYEAAGPVGMEP